ncbi:hypothetical protein SAMN06893096_102413 [Geodermatophilus pulveris]|uniref:Uncharacterized protein n=1 Tax=Geodermatophilus pulveris TaxID=1564159 RepID=A0A239CFP5_9ACTN|nr:hypothetical protein [Geodermatophilus pulveris]SNS18799.1 hypothetical protein SAMN06893096_102413 [Geodermatophilus pulveris]
MAQAPWVTHAAGAARCLARSMTGRDAAVAGLDALRPDRSASRSERDLTADALRPYNDIYATT